MRWRNTTENWGAVAKALHWTVAVLVIAMIPFGFWMESVEPLDRLVEMYQWHKAAGLLVLLFVLTRLVWRATSKTPALPKEMGAWERRAAKAGHYGLYALILAQPIVGVAMSQASSFNDICPVTFPGFPVAGETSPTGCRVDLIGVALPDLVANDIRIAGKKLGEILGAAHFWIGWALVVMIAGHALAALKHHFIDGTRILVRMLPGR